MMTDARAINARLRMGETPTPEELAWFARGLATGEVTDAQAGAFAMAVCLRGLGEAGRAEQMLVVTRRMLAQDARNLQAFYLQAVLAARAALAPRRPWRAAGSVTPPATGAMQDVQARLKAREAPLPRFCWHCDKALPARTDVCPFCRETQPPAR